MDRNIYPNKYFCNSLTYNALKYHIYSGLIFVSIRFITSQKIKFHRKLYIANDMKRFLRVIFKKYLKRFQNRLKMSDFPMNFYVYKEKYLKKISYNLCHIY